jgi:hypothetical protein
MYIRYIEALTESTKVVIHVENRVFEMLITVNAKRHALGGASLSIAGEKIHFSTLNDVETPAVCRVNTFFFSNFFKYISRCLPVKFVTL